MKTKKVAKQISLFGMESGASSFYTSTCYIIFFNGTQAENMETLENIVCPMINEKWRRGIRRCCEWINVNGKSECFAWGDKSIAGRLAMQKKT